MSVGDWDLVRLEGMQTGMQPVRSMGYRVTEIKGKKGWYVLIDKPRQLRKLRGSNTVKKKAGDTLPEARRNADAIVSKVHLEWQQQLAHNPIEAAKRSKDLELLDLPQAVDLELRQAGYSREDRDAVERVLRTNEPIQDDLPQELQAGLSTLHSDCLSWQEWVGLRKLETKSAAATIANWESKLRNLAQWYGSDQVGTMTRKQAHAYKVHLIRQGKRGQTVVNNIGSFSGFWNWALTAGQIDGENIWTGLKKGIETESKRAPLSPSVLVEAETKARERKDIRFFIGRYQGLRKQDYCGLRWCDLDMNENVLHLRRYDWKGQVRTFKMKAKGERTVPIHSELVKLIHELLPEAAKRDDATPIWPKDYTHKLTAWGARYSESFTWRYGFGTHDLRALVVTRMMKCNINPFFLEHITGHKVQGNQVIAGYVQPTLEEVREVLELLN